jgi:hypothetical protein
MIFRRSFAALGVVLVATGCAPPGTRLQAQATEPLRRSLLLEGPLQVGPAEAMTSLVAQAATVVALLPTDGV